MSRAACPHCESQDGWRLHPNCSHRFCGWFECRACGAIYSPQTGGIIWAVAP